ncbi:MAG: rod shape-determining protein [Clostridia bacterium]|nr:rod shape-determining protein [Clostridia bacterium]
MYTPDIGIDLGSSNTMVYVRDRGIVINEPSLVMVEGSNRRTLHAVGDEAARSSGRTLDTQMVIHPIRNGVISDFDMTALMIKYFLRKAVGVSNVFKPRVIVSVPAGMDDINRKALAEAVRVSKITKIHLMEKPLAAALGSNLPAWDPVGSMVVDIGGGTTDVAVISLGGLVVSQSIPVGGQKMDEAIINHIKREFKMLIGDRTAEHIKIDLGAAMPMAEERSRRIRGRDLLTPQNMEIEYTSRQAYQAIHEPCRAIVKAIRWVLERTPPELCADILRTGIHLTGGGAQLSGMDQFIATELGIPVLVAREPGDCTVQGLGHIVQNVSLYTQIGRMPPMG